MGATIITDNGLKIVRLTNVVRKAELDAIQWSEARELGPDSHASVLVLAEQFAGWHPDDQWGDVRFVATYGDYIDKMALVAAPEWEDRLMMFTGAGLRHTMVKFFPTGQADKARAWLEKG